MNCKKCGNELKVDTSVILTSYPPQYNAYCPVCDERTYVYCNEYNSELNRLKIEEYFNNQQWEPVIQLDGDVLSKEYLVKLINEVIDKRLGGKDV